jgi:hypothetical protein
LKLQSLKNLNKEIQDKYAHLKKISINIAKAADALSGLIEFASKAL